MARVPFEAIRENYKRCVEGSAPKPLEFAKMVAEQIGYVDSRGRTFTDAKGAPCLSKDRKKNPTDYNLQDLTEALLGDRWQEVLGLNTPGNQFPFRRLQRLQEEAVAPIGPSFLVNVSAWTATVGGLLDATMLQGYETTEFDFADFFPIKQATFWHGGQRIPAIIGPSEMAPEVGPGESHPDADLNAMWVETQGPKKYGSKATITKEAAFVDITGGQVIQRALDIGYGIKFREHDLSLNAIVGLTNNFKLGLNADTSATGYNTYGATVPAGRGTTATLGNDITNPMGDLFTTFEGSDAALTAYVHPVTGIPMPMGESLNTILLPSTLAMYGRFLLGIGDVTIGTIAGGTPPVIGGGTFPTSSVTGKNPWAGRFTDVRVSQWLWAKHKASATPAKPTIPAGLALSDADAKRWYRIDPARFACRLQAWDLNTIDLAPNGFVMADQGLVAGRVANIATSVQILSPWAIQRNKVA